MASFLSQLAALIAGPVKPPAANRPAPAGPKSAERIANERSILENRRKILANLAATQGERDAKRAVQGVVDKDTAQAAEIVRRILLDQGNR